MLCSLYYKAALSCATPAQNFKSPMSVLAQSFLKEGVRVERLWAQKSCWEELHAGGPEPKVHDEWRSRSTVTKQREDTSTRPYLEFDNGVLA